MENLIEKIKNDYELFGFKEYRVNLFEEYAHYQNGNSYVDDSKVVKLIHPSNKVYALQADITMAVLKSYENSKDNIGISQKYYYHAQTYKNKIGINQGLQCINSIGVEWFGTSDVYSDAEIIMLANKTMAYFDRSYLLEVGVSYLVKDLFLELMNTNNYLRQVEEYIKKRNFDELLLYLQECEFERNDIELFIRIISLKGNYYDVLDKLEDYQKFKTVSRVIIYLRNLADCFKNYLTIETLAIDLGISTNQKYYNGLVFQGCMEGVYLPVLRGGRYDETSKLTNIKAIGFSIEIDNLKINKKNSDKKSCNLILYDCITSELMKYRQYYYDIGEQTDILPIETLNSSLITNLKRRYYNIYVYRNNTLTKEENLCI